MLSRAFFSRAMTFAIVPAGTADTEPALGLILPVLARFCANEGAGPWKPPVIGSMQDRFFELFRVPPWQLVIVINLS